MRIANQMAAPLAVSHAVLAGSLAVAQEPADWAMYNYDLRGTRHNAAETAIGPANASQLEEKWRFPPKGSADQIGVIHATPVVVGGCVYFGQWDQVVAGAHRKRRWNVAAPWLRLLAPPSPFFVPGCAHDDFPVRTNGLPGRRPPAYFFGRCGNDSRRPRGKTAR